MFNIEIIKKRIEGFKPIKTWEVMYWAQQELKQAVKRGEKELFETIISLLPRAIILALGADTHRSVIFQVKGGEYSRIAECLPERHPPHKNFPRSEMPPPLKELIDNGYKNIYITSPLDDLRTVYMKKLIESKEINAIYYTKVDIPNSKVAYILVVDAFGKCREIDDNERRFLDILCQVVKEIEEERIALEKEMNNVVDDRRKEMAIFLLGMIHHVVGNKVMSIGGLAKNLRNKNKPILLEAIIKDSKLLEGILKDLIFLVEKLRKGFVLSEYSLGALLGDRKMKDKKIITDIERAQFLINSLTKKIGNKYYKVEGSDIIFLDCTDGSLKEIDSLIKIVKRRRIVGKNCCNVYSLENLSLAFAIMMFRESGGDIVVDKEKKQVIIIF